jgi:replication-associated recombination protein RarA
MPECRINLAHCIAYLAESPKSTRSYEAYNRAEEAAKRDATAPVPIHLRNAPTRLMKELGYGKEYAYNPSYAWVFVVSLSGGVDVDCCIGILCIRSICRLSWMRNSS